ncbi:coiled-coil domain-containing protein 42 like-2-like [Osmerus mordax]|uniref:coiled-coil domain-containing protein 42 like-2-like n=1 Tax=Osmerus mordax TaxID=8014 RepID=UPI00350FA5CC
MRLIQKRREEMETQNTLEACRQKFDQKLSAQRVRKEELEKREADIKDDLRNFDSFLKESQLKWSRAGRRAVRERALAAQAAAQLVLLRRELKELTLKKEKLLTLVQKHKIFPRYLDQVVRASEQFQEAWQATSRMDTLLQTREDLLSSTQQNESCSQRIRAQLRHVQDQTSGALLVLNNQLASLQVELDKARHRTAVWENRWAHIQNTAAKDTLLLGTIKVAILNLYQITSKKTKDSKETVALEDTATQLEKVQTYLRNLSAVWEEVNRC